MDIFELSFKNNISGNFKLHEDFKEHFGFDVSGKESLYISYCQARLLDIQVQSLQLVIDKLDSLNNKLDNLASE
jgi:hypothetical protein